MWLIMFWLLQSQTIMWIVVGPERLEKSPLSTSQNGKIFIFVWWMYQKMKSNATTVPQKVSKTGLMKWSKPFSLSTEYHLLQKLPQIWPGNRRGTVQMGSAVPVFSPHLFSWWKVIHIVIVIIIFILNHESINSMGVSEFRSLVYLQIFFLNEFGICRRACNTSWLKWGWTYMDMDKLYMKTSFYLLSQEIWKAMRWQNVLTFTQITKGNIWVTE